MPTSEHAQLRTRCAEHRARLNYAPATSTFTCSICPASLICDVPLKKRVVIFGAETPAPSDAEK